MTMGIPFRNERQPFVCMLDHSPSDQIVGKTSLLLLFRDDVKAILHTEHHVVRQGVNPRFGTALAIDAVLQVADLREHINGGELDYQVATHQ